MAAYAALTSLLQILDQLEHHPFPPISLDRQQVDSLTEIATFLQEFLEEYDSPFVDSDEADPLEMRIADAAYAAEDMIESYIVDNIHFAAAATHDDEVNCSWGDEVDSEEEINSYEGVSSGGESSLSGEEESNSNEETASLDDEVNSCSTDQVNSEEEINSDEDASSGLAGEAINISGGEISCVHMYQDLWRVIEEMDLVKKEAMEKTAVQAHHQPQRNILRSSSFGGKNSGVMVGFDGVLLQLLDKVTGEPSSLQVIPITGMGGIGKTTLARNIFQHAYVKEHFDICAWVTISQQYNTREILSQIFFQARGKSSEKNTVEELGDELRRYLFDRRYLIIMDDIWSIKVWEKMSFYFPSCNKGSRIVFTTRQSFLTSQLTRDSHDVFHMKFLDEDNSWNLFSKIVFGEEGFPPQLKKIGKRIVEKCRGLPLSIVVVGGLLAKSQHTQKYWEHIEQNFNSIVNLENDEFCLKILKLSYHHLPAYLKPCFLYMGIFEEDTRIHVSTLVKQWVSEGFLKPENGKSLELIGEGFVKDLIDRNLILVDVLGKTGNIKYCKMHDLLRDLCMKEAENERFYNVIGQHSRRGIQNHKRRRMVSDRSTSKERVMGSLESTRFHVRYLIYGSDGWIRLTDVIVNSHYAAIINSSEKPKFLSLMNFIWNLHILQINVRKLIVAPIEIWKMSQLRHVEFKWGGNMYLPDPPSGSSIVILENLQTLTGILNFKCGEEMVKRIPNIKKLQMEYFRRHDGDDYYLSNLHSLHKLESLTINVHRVDDDFLHNIIFPRSLIKLSLELTYDTGVGWEEMLEKIGGSLPLLQKLKLRYGVFKTGKWETIEGQFPSLKFLELSYCQGLKQWMIEESSHFPCLEHLHLSLLHQLEEIPLEIGEIPTLKSIGLTFCSISAVKSAKRIVEEQEELQGGEKHLPFLVRVQESHWMREALQSLRSRNFQFKLRIGDRLPLIIPVGAAASSIAFEAILLKVMMMVEKKSDIFQSNFCEDLQKVKEDMYLIDRRKVVEMMRKKIIEKCRGLRSSFNGCDCRSCMVLEAQEMALGVDFADIYKNSQLYRESTQRSYVFDRIGDDEKENCRKMERTSSSFNDCDWRS